jgi:hypothetical protein
LYQSFNPLAPIPSSVFYWAVPTLTGTLVLALAGLTTLLYFVPLHLLLLFAIDYVFVKRGLHRFHFLKKSKGISKSPTFVENILSRAPSDLDLLRRRRLPPKSSSGHYRSPPPAEE